MKKIITLLTLILLISPLIVNADLKEELQGYTSQIQEDSAYRDSIGKFAKALPLSIKIVLTD